MRAYGISNFYVAILELCQDFSDEDLRIREMELINLYDPNLNCRKGNISDGTFVNTQGKAVGGIHSR